MSGAAALPFDLARLPRLREVLDALQYEAKEPPPTEHHALFAVAEGATIAVYRSGKLLVQGKRRDEILGELAAFGLVAGAPSPRPSPRGERETGGEEAPPPLIGTDESGKGDYFGPLVVAAAYVEPATWARLRGLGVRDSKTVPDGMVRRIAPQVRSLCPHASVTIGPAKYNDLHEKMGNVNRILAWAHARAIEDLLAVAPCERVLTDQFASDPGLVERALMERGKRVSLSQRPRAEEETAVAAASILAREIFLLELQKLSDRFGILLLKGASDRVEEAARAFVRAHGPAKLREVAKLHFRTTERVV